MRKKHYLVLDTETATLPFLSQLAKTEKQKQKVSIAKPLVYDIGWVVMDRQGNITKSVNYLVQETFFVPNVFNTAYYCEKRPIYMDLLARGEISARNWNDIMEELLIDLRYVDISAAYNAQFDFKKAIPFTERYIQHLYDADYNEWERQQYGVCMGVIQGKNPGENPDFMEPFFELREERFPITDLWAIACDRLINIDKYRDYCLSNQFLTNSAQYFCTNAETCFQYLMKQHDFIEDHTALSDANIEAQILTKALKKGKVEPYLDVFPFKNLGTTFDYVTDKRPKYKPVVVEALRKYIDKNGGATPYWGRLKNILMALEADE